MKPINCTLVIVKLEDCSVMSVEVESAHRVFVDLFYGKFWLVVSSWAFGIPGEMYMQDLFKKDLVGRFKFYKRIELNAKKFKDVLKIFENLED